MMDGHPEEHAAVWLGDGLVTRSEARVDALSLGFLMGAGVFETLRVYRGLPLAWDAHARRLRRSSIALDLPDPPSAETLRRAVDAVVAENCVREGLARVTWAAAAPDVSGGILLVHTRQLPARCSIAGDTGLNTFSVALTRPAGLAQHKSMSYHAAWRALSAARRRGVDWEALLIDHAGMVWEGATTNVFACIDGGWRTPPVDDRALAGVARADVLLVAAHAGVSIEERTIHVGELARAAAAFLTSSSLGVATIRTFDGHDVGHAPVVDRLAEKLWGLWLRQADA